MDERLQAQVVSTAIADQVCAPGFAARVHSVFERAVNLVSGDELLTLALPSVGALPNGIVLEAAGGFVARGIAPGMLLRGNGAHLRLDGHPFALSLTEAVPWSPLVRPVGTLRSLHVVAAPLTHLLRGAPMRGGFRPLLARVALGDGAPLPGPLAFPCSTAGRNVAAVLRGLEAGSLDEAVAAASQLVGLGHGLTPSGDDFLVGLSAALQVTGDPLAEPFASQCAQAARGRTTRVAETFFAYAARGMYSARLHGLLGALGLDAPDERLSQALALTLDWGESSGADCLLGVLLGSTIARTPSTVGVS